jgi:hypothetical protein
MHPVWSKNSSWSLCPESEIIALRTLMINQAREVFYHGSFQASLIYMLIVSPSPAEPIRTGSPCKILSHAISSRSSFLTTRAGQVHES